MAYNFVNKNPGKESQFRDDVKEKSYSYIPKIKDDFHDVFAELEKEMAEDPDRKVQAFAEAAEAPVEVGLNVLNRKSKQPQEIVPQIPYQQPHHIRKYPGHLAGQQDSFENPYARQQQTFQVPNYPQMQPQGYPQAYPAPQGYPSYPGTNYGRRRRKKRAVEKDYDAHWGIHRIMSTGNRTLGTLLIICLTGFVDLVS